VRDGGGLSDNLIKMELSLLSAGLIPVVLAITEVIKRLGVATKWIPLIALVLGVLTVWAVDIDGGARVLEGIVVGLSAAGLYSGTKATIA